MNRFKGFLYGMIASSTFGLLPLFTLPIRAEGTLVESILTYRMLLASLLVAVLMLVRRMSFRVELRELAWYAWLGFFYYGSATLLFQSYGIMPSGMATTLHFLYPVAVTLIMAIVFRQRPSIVTLIAIALALTGVALLSLQSGTLATPVPIVVTLLVLLSGFSYATYLVTMNNVRRMREAPNLKLTFYVLLFSALYFYVHTQLTGGLQPVQSSTSWVRLLLMAFLPTLVSNLALVRAVKSIGSTLTSVLGAMEPLTAILVGILVFGEPLSTAMAIGMVLIIAAVSLIVLSPLLDKRIADRLERLSKHRPPRQ